MLKDFKTGPFFGEIKEAIPPGELTDTPIQDDWHLHVLFTDGEEEDIPLRDIRDLVLKKGTSHQDALLDHKQWVTRISLYQTIRSHLLAESFPNVPDPDGIFPVNLKCLREILGFNLSTGITASKIKQKMKYRTNQYLKELRPSSQRRHLRHLLIQAVNFLGEVYIQRHCHGRRPTVDPPTLETFPDYDSQEFAKQVNDRELLTSPDNMTNGGAEELSDGACQEKKKGSNRI